MQTYFEEPEMTLTVRLDDATAAALAEHCAASGTTKSRVVQQSLVAYLMGAKTVEPAARQRRISAAFTAFDRAGLIGSGVVGTTSADKAAVRRRVTGG